MKLILTLIAAIVLSVSVYAGNENNKKNVNASKAEVITEATAQVQLIGSVIDEKNNESLAGASILVDGVKHYSDLDGNFILKNLVPGKHQIVVELISYEPKSIDITVQNDTKINVGLVQK
jgi:hypothetical protein